MSYKYGEIIKKPYFLFGEMPARGLLKPPPFPPRQESAELTSGKRADAGRGREIQTQNWEAENGGKGGNNAQRRRSLTVHYFAAKFKMKIVQTLLPYCVGKMCLSPSGALWRPLAFLYCGAEPIKGSPSQWPALSRLHYILQSTPL
jgi:hypothetical protein